MAPAFISRLPKDEQKELLDDLNYLNIAEIKSFCKRHLIPYRITIQTKDGGRKTTQDADRKGVILNRIRHFLQTGVTSEISCCGLRHAPIRPQNLSVNPSAVWPSQQGDYVGNVFNLSKSFQRIQLAQVIGLLRRHSVHETPTKLLSTKPHRRSFTIQRTSATAHSEEIASCARDARPRPLRKYPKEKLLPLFVRGSLHQTPSKPIHTLLRSRLMY